MRDCFMEAWAMVGGGLVIFFGYGLIADWIAARRERRE